MNCIVKYVTENLFEHTNRFALKNAIFLSYWAFFFPFKKKNYSGFSDFTYRVSYEKCFKPLTFEISGAKLFQARQEIRNEKCHLFKVLSLFFSFKKITGVFLILLITYRGSYVKCFKPLTFEISEAKFFQRYRGVLWCIFDNISNFVHSNMPDSWSYEGKPRWLEHPFEGGR